MKPNLSGIVIREINWMDKTYRVGDEIEGEYDEIRRLENERVVSVIDRLPRIEVGVEEAVVTPQENTMVKRGPGARR